MSSRTRIRQGMTLEEFLELPDNDDLEYIDGRIERKVSPQKHHSLLSVRLPARLNGWAEPAGLGFAFVELRCTFAGRSIVADIAFLLKEHIEIDTNGEPVNETWRPPDLHVEIISPQQSVKRARENLAHSTSNGCPLGWLINPEAKPRTIDVYCPGRPAERLPADGVLEGEPVLPGFRLPVAEVFAWLKLGY
jgi:Uma2 family endonuclease